MHEFLNLNNNNALFLRDDVGGYYVIEQARLQLHLVALNTNYYSEVNHATAESEDPDPGGQWAWLESILLKARRRRGTVSSRVFIENII